MTVDDVARFRSDEPDEVVGAAFACPVCLRGPAAVGVRGAEHDRHLACACDGCALTWRVALDESQVLRLALAPPSRLPVGAIGA
jgi:hypothetical protein